MDGMHGPSLRHLRVFNMVAQLQSVRKAADAVHLSQPAVTQAITKLELQVGATLFERRSSGTYLTPAGEIFATRIAMMFAQIEDALCGFGVPVGKGKSLSSVAARITRPQIRGLAAVADGRSFADAARRVGISQASLHRAARELERNLGKPLFHNSIYGVITTRGGAELARKLSLAMRELEWGIEEIQAAAGQKGGELRIGAMPLAGSFLLAPVLNELTKLFPQVRVQVRTGDGVSLTRALTGFFCGALAGIILATAMARSALFARLIQPLIFLGYPVPKIALFPIFIFIFGVGSSSKIAFTFLECLYPVVITTYLGIRAIDTRLIWTAQNFGASRPTILRRVVLPAILPSIFSGLRIALPLAITVVVVTEMIGDSSGLGYYINIAGTRYRFAYVYAGILAVGLIGLLLDGALRLLRDRIMHWKAAEASL